MAGEKVLKGSIARTDAMFEIRAIPQPVVQRYWDEAGLGCN